MELPGGPGSCCVGGRSGILATQELCSVTGSAPCVIDNGELSRRMVAVRHIFAGVTAGDGTARPALCSPLPVFCRPSAIIVPCPALLSAYITHTPSTSARHGSHVYRSSVRSKEVASLVCIKYFRIGDGKCVYSPLPLGFRSNLTVVVFPLRRQCTCWCNTRMPPCGQSHTWTQP